LAETAALIWFASRSHGVVIDHIDVQRLIGPYELGLVFVTAIMRRLQLFPNEIALFVYVSFIDRCGDDLSYDHHAMQPLLCPFNLAFEMTSACRYAWRLYDRRREGRKAGFLELIDSRREFQSDNSYLLEDLPLEGRNVDDKFLGCQNVVVGIFGSPGRESDVHRIVAHPHTSAV